MPIDPSGWHMDAGTPTWDAKAKTFSFYLHKRAICTSGAATACCAWSPQVLWRVQCNQAVFPKPPFANIRCSSVADRTPSRPEIERGIDRT
jgi:hypothetical protein